MIVKHKNLTGLKELKSLLNGLVSLDIIMMEEADSWLRVYHKIKAPDGKSCIFKVDNGAGDELFIVFSEMGCIIKGFDHESFFSPYARDEFYVWPGIYENVPQGLLCLLDDPMYEKDDVTFCIWREMTTDWQKGDIENPNEDDDGSDFLFGFLFPTAADYEEWAKDYYDKEIPLEIIERVYAGERITEEIVAKINSERDVQQALEEINSL